METGEFYNVFHFLYMLNPQVHIREANFKVKCIVGFSSWFFGFCIFLSMEESLVLCYVVIEAIEAEK